MKKAIIERLPVCTDNQDTVIEAMKYSLTNGGKRLRQFFVLNLRSAAVWRKKKAIDFACAVEYIHTYSLIHDDLPCMDDDDFRRESQAVIKSSAKQQLFLPEMHF